MLALNEREFPKHMQYEAIPKAHDLVATIVVNGLVEQR
jgi:hypothetical protein